MFIHREYIAKTFTRPGHPGHNSPNGVIVRGTSTGASRQPRRHEPRRANSIRPGVETARLQQQATSAAACLSPARVTDAAAVKHAREAHARGAAAEPQRAALTLEPQEPLRQLSCRRKGPSAPRAGPQASWVCSSAAAASASASPAASQAR